MSGSLLIGPPRRSSCELPSSYCSNVPASPQSSTCTCIGARPPALEHFLTRRATTRAAGGSADARRKVDEECVAHPAATHVERAGDAYDPLRFLDGAPAHAQRGLDACLFV